MQQKALTRFLQEEKDALRSELAQLKSGAADAAAQLSGADVDRLQQELTELRQTLTNIIEPREAVRLVLSVFEETRRLTHASIYLLEPDGNGYELAGHFGVRPTERLDAAARRPLLARLLATRQAITLDQLEREHNTLTAKRDTASEVETLDAVARTLVELHAGAVIGIFAGKPSEPQRTGRHPSASGTLPRIEGAELLVPSEALLGVLCIKDERVSDAFASAELDVLIGVAAQLGITLQNSKLYERMKERDRLAALGQMAAGLAHEIRNPLGAIKGAAEFIAPLPDGTVPEDAGEFLHIIVDETKRLNRVVSQFLDYARPFRGDMEQLDINDVVRKLVVMFRPLVDEIFSARRGLPAPAALPAGASDRGEPGGPDPQPETVPEIVPEIVPKLAPELEDARRSPDQGGQHQRRREARARPLRGEPQQQPEQLGAVQQPAIAAAQGRCETRQVFRPRPGIHHQDQPAAAAHQRDTVAVRQGAGRANQHAEAVYGGTRQVQGRGDPVARSRARPLGIGRGRIRGSRIQELIRRFRKGLRKRLRNRLRRGPCRRLRIRQIRRIRRLRRRQTEPLLRARQVLVQLGQRIAQTPLQPLGPGTVGLAEGQRRQLSPDGDFRRRWRDRSGSPDRSLKKEQHTTAGQESRGRSERV